MRRYLIFAVVTLILLLAAIDATAVAVAFPVIISSFDVSLIVAGWVMSSYQLAVTTATPVAGKISDALGRKTTFLVFLSLFTVGSVLCSVAPNAPSLIVFRLLQGLGGSGFMPSATGIVAEEFPRSRQQAIGLFTSIFPLGWIIGPNLGAWMTSALGWRSIFWINIPLCVAAWIIAAFLMKKGQRGKSSIDLAGAGLLGGALFALMAALSEMGSTDTGTPWLVVGLLFVASLCCLFFFWRRQRRVENPIIDPEVFSRRPFIAANVYNFFYGWVLGAMSLIPLYAVSIYGMSTLESGLVLTPRSVGMVAASTLVSFSIVRWGYRRPILVGTAFLVPGFVLLALEPAGFNIFGYQSGSMMFLMLLTGLVGLCSGVIAPAANNACIELMPHRVSTITGIRVMFRQGGSAIAITAGSLLLHNVGIARGFQYFFIGLVALQLFVQIPALLAMPRSATDRRKVVARNTSGA